MNFIHHAYTRAFFLGIGVMLLSPLVIAEAKTPEEEDLLALSLEDLLDIEVTSVSKKARALSDSAAAVFVISSDDIKRSGATNLPDILRMVPGLHVARIDANKWAVTARGLNGRFANKLLVLIDGRSVYSPSFSGVYWEVQDLMLEDVERIEVIRGPGATLWGANAVNGVINVITKHSADTQGGLISAGGGTEERGFGAARYGFKVGALGYGRAFIKGFKRDELVRSQGGSAGDDWSMIHGGVRMDYHPTQQDSVMVQGNAYSGDINQIVMVSDLNPPFSVVNHDHVDVSGWHVLTNWQHTLSATSEFKLQAYYDHTNRKELVIEQTHDIFDLDFQHQFGWGKRHDFIWGLNYRYVADTFRHGWTFKFNPRSRDTHLISGFVQDEVTLIPRQLWLTVGTKLEHNTFTGVEVQPTARILWAPHPHHRLWAAFSRAVRTPSRAEDDSQGVINVIPPATGANLSPFPIAMTFLGNRNVRAEVLLAYELGYRFMPLKSLSLDAALFYHDFQNLQSNELRPPVFHGSYVEQPLVFANQRQAGLYGFELAATWHPMAWLRGDLAYSFLKTRLDFSKESDVTPQAAKSPRHQVSLRTRMNLNAETDFDLWFRYVGKSKAITTFFRKEAQISRYFTLDARIAWRPLQNLEVSLTGQNLLSAHHLEYVQESFTLPTEVQRGVYGKVEWRF